MSTFRQQQPSAVRTGAAIDSDYDYKAAATPTPTTASAAGISQMRAYGSAPPPPPPGNGGQSINSARSVDVDEALLDLAQLEELHQEAERMKALGNKHMAGQVRAKRYIYNVNMRIGKPIDIVGMRRAVSLSLSLSNCVQLRSPLSLSLYRNIPGLTMPIQQHYSSLQSDLRLTYFSRIARLPCCL
jgi:hypothetical protein